MRKRIAGPLAAVLLVVTGVAGSGGVLSAASAVGNQSASAGAGSPGGSQLGPGQVLAPGQTLTSPGGQITLTMQFDGNLVGYATVDGESRVLWASGTEGSPGAQSVMQSDGNLVVYSSTGSALWSSGTTSHPGAVVTVQDDGNTVVYSPSGSPLWSSGTALDFVGPDEGPSLEPGQDLLSGQFLQSTNGQYRLYETPEGAPALYQQGTDGLWWLIEGSDSLVSVPGIPTFFSCTLCTESASVLAGSFFTLQDDGNLVLYPPGGGPDEWSADIAGRGGASLQLQDDGNLVLYGMPDSAGEAPVVWQTGTNVFRGSVLGEGVTLQAGQFILSPDGAFELVMQADGNLVAYGAGSTGALWASGTSGDHNAFLAMQDDDNLVVYGQEATAAVRPAATAATGQGGPDVADWASGTTAPSVSPDVTYATVAAAPYAGWLSTTAAPADRAAQPARAAAAAFETASAATVPPPLVAANRAQLQALVATNIFGQNTPAIAASEAQYEEMWAQDVAAMAGYQAAASSAAPSIALTELNDVAYPVPGA
jgi:hypothetical protein